MLQGIDRFRAFFNESTFWKKLAKLAQAAGIRTVYTALLLYFAFCRKDTPSWAKRIVMGTLGYLLMPIDAIPDLTPFIGYTDDLGLLSIGLVTVAAYVNAEVKAQARARLTKWFPQAAESDLAAVEKKL